LPHHKRDKSRGTTGSSGSSVSACSASINPGRASDSQFSLENNQSLSILSFVPTIEDDGKYLTCRAENPDIPDSALEDKWRLDVQYQPVVSLKMGETLNPDDIKEGDDVYFECVVRANPKVYKLAWFKDVSVSRWTLPRTCAGQRFGFADPSIAPLGRLNRPTLRAILSREAESAYEEASPRHQRARTILCLQGKELKNNSTAGVVLSDHSLVLQGLTRYSAGDYTCLAVNSEGKTASNPVSLQIMCKSKIKRERERERERVCPLIGGRLLKLSRSGQSKWTPLERMFAAGFPISDSIRNHGFPIIT